MHVWHDVMYLQVWRGTIARMRYRRMRAALVILQAYRRYKVKSYVREVNRRFRNVRSMKDYGRHVKWPTPPKVLRKFEEALRSIHSRYLRPENGRISAAAVSRITWRILAFKSRQQAATDVQSGSCYVKGLGAILLNFNLKNKTAS